MEMLAISTLHNAQGEMMIMAWLNLNVTGLLLQWCQQILSLLQARHLVTATDMIEENMERGKREFAAKALPRGQA